MDRATRRSPAILMAESPFSSALIIAARVVSDNSGLGAGFLGFVGCAMAELSLMVGKRQVVGVGFAEGILIGLQISHPLSPQASYLHTIILSQISTVEFR